MEMETQTQARFTAPTNAAIWFEIPVTDMERAKAFYTKVLGTEFMDDNTGPNPISIFGYSKGDDAVSGHLNPGKPARDGEGPTIHLAVPDGVKSAMSRVESAGGKVLSPIIEIPAGRFVYCTDPDGNSIGLFSR